MFLCFELWARPWSLEGRRNVNQGGIGAYLEYVECWLVERVWVVVGWKVEAVGDDSHLEQRVALQEGSDQLGARHSRGKHRHVVLRQHLKHKSSIALKIKILKWNCFVNWTLQCFVVSTSKVNSTAAFAFCQVLKYIHYFCLLNKSKKSKTGLFTAWLNFALFGLT